MPWLELVGFIFFYFFPHILPSLFIWCDNACAYCQWTNKNKHTNKLKYSAISPFQLCFVPIAFQHLFFFHKWTLFLLSNFFSRKTTICPSFDSRLLLILLKTLAQIVLMNLNGISNIEPRATKPKTTKILWHSTHAKHNNCVFTCSKHDKNKEETSSSRQWRLNINRCKYNDA